MSSSITEPINVRGLTISLIESPGMTVILPPDELIANPFKEDVGATRIRFKLNTATRLFLVSDNGSGMNEEGMIKSQVIHDRKPASDGGQGFAGIGVVMSLAKITNAKSKATIISKTADGVLHEVSRDFPKIMATNKIPEISVGDITVPSYELWNKEALDKTRGTLIHCIASEEYVKQFLEALSTDDVTKNLLIQLGMSWYIPLSNGKVIEIIVDDKTYTLQPIDPLAWNKVEKKRDTEIEVYTNTIEYLVYFKDTEGKYTLFKDKKADKEYIHPPPSATYNLVGKLNFRSAYSGNWEEIQKPGIPSQKAHELDYFGGIYYTRNPENKGCAKILTHHQNVSKTSETGGMQGIRRACRHDIRFSSILDSLFGVTYNKSYIEKLNIQRNVLEVVEYLINLFVRQVSKHVKKHEESSSSESDKPSTTGAPAPKSVRPKGAPLLAHEKATTAAAPAAAPAVPAAPTTTAAAPAAAPAAPTTTTAAPAAAPAAPTTTTAAPAAAPAAAPTAPTTTTAAPAAVPAAPAAPVKNELKIDSIIETKEQQALKKFGISIDLLSNNQIKIYVDGKTITIPGTALERDIMRLYVSKKPSKEEAKTKIAEFVAVFTN